MRDGKPLNGADRVFPRRDRWGKLQRASVCTVCGRCLWSNWTRAAPCLWCDDSVRVLRAVSRDLKHGEEGKL
jgi:hypothetical protein